MTSSTDTECDSDTRLRELMARGFQFMQSTDSRGELLALVGVRGHDNVIDVVRLESEDHVTATRMPSWEENVFAPNTTWWHSSGPVCEVLDELLELPDDHTPGSLLLLAGI
ncbi:hypothetical protein SAMN04487905_102389 [Actinopolyspora xinjiangensis]|uniref:Uncharacterized protein n=1 Tax=Actinopolyspora xinjiangensis TaxID=405564 RepID=A0A1H0QTE8_9ACTN|nr:hypothetical protein [Actinopolyspora xinjiangensis]SDP20611.1 hypothetical protein SAMN04487905_102389 [Actinopolyspora xinjiangensis]